MRKLVLLPLGLIGGLFTWAPANAAVVSLTSVADTFVVDVAQGVDVSGNNYGGAGALMVAKADLTPGTPSTSYGDFKSLVRFDTSGVKAQFDAQFGVGTWHVTSIALTHAANF